jgi:uncharacterized repeat protein (TIGR03803 family)
METPKIPQGRRIILVTVTLAIVGLLVLGWLWLRRPQPPSGKVAQETTAVPVQKTPANAGREDGAPVAQTAAVAASPDDHHGKLSNLDTRAAAGGRGDDKRQRALAALRGKIPGVDVQFDPITGAPNHIMATGRFLSGGKPQPGDAYASVREFVNEYADLFGHDATAINDSRVTRDDVTAHNGMRTVVWQQQVDGVPLYNSILKANLTKDGTLVTLGSHFLSDASAATGMDVAQRTALVAQPPVDVKKAISLAAANLGDAVAPEQARETMEPQGAERTQRFTAPKISDTLAQLSWLPVSADSAKLTWDVTLMSLKQNEMFRVLVDAKTGEVLLRTSLTNDVSDATFRVYADATTKKPFDSPNPMLPGTPTPNGVQAAEVPRQLVTLQSVNPTASPNGWINDGITETLGNNVDAHADTNADNVADLPRPTSATRVFDFAMDLTQAPSAYKDAAVTHLFYMNNWMHDQLYTLGFTETAGNFQTNNFGRGGLGNDPVQADGQDGSGTNNANMSTPGDGSSPRMQMYIFTGPTPDRDGDFDDVVLLHEYTHGLSNRLVGGGVGLSALASRGMGEGWSDFYGLALLADPATDPNAVYPGGSYATLNFVSGMTTNYYYGIRRYPYSTDLTKNPLTFRDIDPSQASPHTGIPLSPLFGSSNSNPSEVHNVGEVWCMTLWECRANLVAKHGPGGAQMILQLVTDAMKLSPANPNLLQSRDAVIQADLVSSGGANRIELWAAFAKRGMGASATSPASSTTTGVVEAFDVPDDLNVSPAAGIAVSGTITGPFASSAYTLLNTGTAPLDWSASRTQAWVAVSPAGGTLAAGASVTVTVSFPGAASALGAGSYNDTVTFTNVTSGLKQTRPVQLTVQTNNQVFYDGFESGALNPAFWTSTGTSTFRTLVTTANTPRAGSQHLTMDSSVDLTYARNELTLTLNLAGRSGALLRFWAKMFSDEADGPPASPFTTGADFDGVAISLDGTTWYEARGLRDLTSGYVQYTVDLDAAIAAHGWSYNSAFKIRFNHYDNYGITTDGFAFDDVEVTANAANPITITAPASVAEGAGTVAASVSVPVAPAGDLTVNLTTTDSAELTVPATVTILAGQTSAAFSITVIDDSLLDGTQNVAVIATAAGYSLGARTIAVDDNETATLSLSVPASVSEIAGTATGTVTMSATATGDVTVNLTSSDTTAIQVPATVLIPAGQSSATFPITVLNDTKINGTHPATLTAHVTNWTDGNATINVTDNENTNLSVSLPGTVTEGLTGTGTVTISGTLPTALTVSLASNNTPRLTVPVSVNIPAGSTSATFTLTAPNNSLTDGSSPATITATAAGFTAGSATTTVADDDVHHYAFNTIAASQTRGVAFSVTITAKDVNNATITGYTGISSLLAAGTGGADSIAPAVTTAFIAGVWTGNVTVNTFDTNVVLTASDGAGHTGASNAFNVAAGALHHFAWNTQPAARAVGAPVSATVTAQDVGNNTVSAFAGTVALNCGLAARIVGTGTGSTTVLPLYTYYHDQRSQVIYLQSEVGAAGTIKGLTLNVTTLPGQTMNNWTIRMKHTALNSYASAAWESTGWTTVYQANQTISATGLATFTFTTPFAYDGASNLMVDFSFNNSSWTSEGGVTYTTAGATRTIHYYTDSGYGDPLTWSGTTNPAPYTSTILPNLQLQMDRTIPISPSVTGNFAGGVWNGTVAVLQPGASVNLRADDGSGHTGDSNAFDVTATLSVSVPTSAPEGSAPVMGTVSISPAAATPLTVTLSSSDLTAATVPATVTIPAGQTSATFPITIMDDGAIDGTQVATITAHIANWTDATANISVLDNETLALTLFLPGTVAEGTAATATVAASGTVGSPLTVSLVSNTTSRLTVPATVTIPSGSSSVTFSLTAVENALTDGSATVNVAASSAGYAGANANTTVLDNDAHHFSIAAIASPQTKGVAFNVTITAQDVGNAVLTGYNGTPGLTASGTGGANAISPANASGFVNGVWTGQITSFAIDTNVVLTVNDGAGHTGASNAFDVVNPLFSPTVVEPVSAANLLLGSNPKAQLILGSDGAFYGTTQFGGSSNQGSVFKMTTAGAMTTLANFYGANGAQPWSGLVLAGDGNFYGTTSSGGANNLGTIFKMTPSGILTTLVHLGTTTGTVPKAPLLQASDGNFYGTTSSGGGSGSGTVFKMTSSGVLTVLVNFTGTGSTAYGSSCQAGLIQATDTNLYGVTSTGGSGGGFGTIFKITLGGTFTSLASFTGTAGANIGSAPFAALLQASDGNLYGTTNAGGPGGFGTVFKVTTAGVFANVFSFTNVAPFAGSAPQAALVQWTDGALYGTTSNGGIGNGNAGTIFKVTTAGVMTTLRNVSTTTDGNNPYGALVLGGDGNFYGAATNGGTWGKGGVFRISPATNAFALMANFKNGPPSFRNLTLAANGNFYGSTVFGGTASFASNSIFRMIPDGTITTLFTFSATGSIAPTVTFGSDGSFYGTIPSEGVNGYAYKEANASVFSTLFGFTGTTGSYLGQNPTVPMIQGSDGYFYGATISGGSGGGYGTVYKMTNTGVFTSLASFTNTTGANLGAGPQTRLVQGVDGNFYGTTNTGGTGGSSGTAFKITPGGVLSTLVNFTGVAGASPGANPNTNLLRASDNTLYGTTNTGGAGGFGTIFKIATDGTFTSLLSFTGTVAGNLGSTPSTNLIQGSDGNLYGTTNTGGAAGAGTVFKVTPAGVLTTLVAFTGTTGAAPGTNPQGTLVQGGDGYFYGTTNTGGIYNLGTVFRVSSSGIFQSLYTIGSSNDGGSPNIGGTSLHSDAYRLIAGTDGYLYGVNTSSVFRVHQQPAPQSIAATGITTTGATLSGSVVPNQDAGTVYYQYGFTISYGAQTAAQNLAAGTSPVAVNASLGGLLPGAIYHFRMVTVTPQGTFYTPDQTFATTSPPLAITGSFTNAGQTGFALDGVVNPLGAPTTYYFEYGTTTAYGTQTTTQGAGGGIADVPVNMAANSLLPGTTYHVRLVATNSVGTTNGDDQVITTFPVSTGTIQPVSQYLSTGTAPLAGLSKAGDGTFYGTMSTGGTFFSAGTVFRMTQGGTLTTLANFYNNTNGALSGNNPQSSPVQGADGNFYGTTNTGGANGSGSIFKMTPAGQVTILVSLNNTSVPRGSNPICGLTVGNDGNFYGVTQNGGTSSLGTIFMVTPSGVFTTLVNFTGTSGSFLGSSPRAALTLGVDGNFYGTTATGGAGGFGTIFKVTPAGVLTTLVQFTGTTGAYPGSTPLGALVQGTDGSLYGTTSLGGVNNIGTVFKVTTTATFTSLAAFSGTSGATLGSTPKGALALMPDGNFYGTATLGGVNNFGTVFSITPAGALSTLVNLTGSTGTALGATPQGALVAGSDGALYGTTNSGGLNNAGTIFKVTTGGFFSTLVNVTAAPNVGRLTEGPGGTLAGATLGGGGANGYGTLFAAPFVGAPATLATLVPVSGTTALNARAGLLRGPDGNYYGTTVAGGSLNSGSVFKVTPAGVYTTLINFTGTSGANLGSSPQAALILGGDGNYYGTASGGGLGSGTVFRMTPAGVQTSLISFTGNTGANLGSSPQAPLTLGSDGNYYGTTTTGGTAFNGTIFKMTPAGVLTTLVNFTGNTGAVPGSSPSGVLVQAADGNFYGTTGSGGTTGFGTVFKVTPGGTFTSLANFTGTTGAFPGQTPSGGLFPGLDGCLYGVTVAGGAYSQGTLFRVAPDNSVASIYTFTGRSEGLAPTNGLVPASDGFLYGGDATAIYRLSPPPVVLAAPATAITANTATLNGSITGETYSGTVRFEYGLTTAYGSATAALPFDSGTTATPAAAPDIAVQPFLTYHFRLGAVTSAGNFNSQDQTFSTPNAATFNTAADVPVISPGFTATGLPLGITLGFAPAPGTVLTLVNNTGVTPVAGLFNGVPNGSVVSATFAAQTYLLLVNYAGGDGNDITLTVVTQAITFPEIPMKLTTDVPFALGATASSGLPVGYTVVAGNASASVAGNTVTLTGSAGVVTIKATQPGDGATFGPAAPVTRTFAVTSGAAFTQLSSSKTNNSGFTLGIRAGGTLWGWGYNGSGQLGNGGTATAVTPVQIGAVTTWKSVSAGNSYAVAVRTDGTLWAWGINTYGQIGDGTNTQRFSPVQIGALTTWAAAVAGYQHTIALKTDGTIWAWGYNAEGELGQGTSDSLTTHTTPVQVGTVTTWTGIASGGYHILATRSDGTLWAWGYNGYGQVGNGSTSNVTAPVQIGTATNWSGLTGGFYSSAALRTDGTVWTWGRNSESQLGDGTLTQRTSPGQLGAATNWQNVQAGEYHFLATKTDGTLWSWGLNQLGQLGQGFNDITLRGNTPVQVGTSTNWTLLAPGYDHSVATKADGTVWSWGDNNNNELGYLGRVPQPVAAPLGPIATASGGSLHSAAIKSDGTLWLWGYNGNGQLGIGASDTSQHPAPVQPVSGAIWTGVGAGSTHTVAVKSDGTLWAWGSNGNGQLGDGTTTQRNSPVQIGTDTNWVKVATGNTHTLALKADGTLWAWGYNSDGQLGNGVADSNAHPVPAQVGTATNWTSVVSHGYHIIATRSDGTLWGWGYNGYGEIGNGTTTSPVSTPLQIGTATNWRSISGGLYHTTATRTDGTLWGWGRNAEGQLGDGTTTQRTSPVQIGTATNWNTVANGNYHTLATKTDGSLWTWGYNFFSQLGNAATANRSAPAQLGTSTGWTRVFEGTNQTLIGTTDGSLWACGSTNFGTTGYAWRNQWVPDLVLPALTPAQTIAFSLPPSVTVGDTITLAAAAGSGLPASYIVAGPALLKGDQLTVTGPGIVTVTAWQPGDSYWQSSDVAVRYINAPVPVVTGVTVSNVTATTATLGGLVNPNGTITVAKFQSGTTPVYGTDTVIPLSPPDGVIDQTAGTVLTGLIPGHIYHFRLIATNGGGTTNGGDLIFNTISLSDASLSALVPGGGALAPAFSSGILSYTDSVSNATAGITVTPTAVNPASTIRVRVNGGAFSPVATGTPSNALALNVGVNAIEVLVTAQDTVTTATYSVATTRRTPYQDWAVANGLGLGAEAMDPNGDSDGDGVKNFHEWAFATNPAARGCGAINVNGGVLLGHGGPTLLTVPDGLGGFSYFAVFGRRKDAATVGLTYVVEFSDTLSGWNVSAVTPTVIAQDGEIEAVSVPFPPIATDPPQAFFHIRVNGQ